MGRCRLLLIVGSFIFFFIIGLHLPGANVGAAEDDCLADSLESVSPNVVTGCKVLKDFLNALNSRNAMAWAKTLNYPHVRLAGGSVTVWNNAEDYAKDNDISKLADKAGWGYTKWDWRRLVQESKDKLHYAVQFTRYTLDGKKIASFESFYVITDVGGHWGVQARSSFAGVVVEGAAF